MCHLFHLRCCIRFIFGSSIVEVAWAQYFPTAAISCIVERKTTFSSFYAHCSQTNLTFIEQTNKKWKRWSKKSKNGIKLFTVLGCCFLFSENSIFDSHRENDKIVVTLLKIIKAIIGHYFSGVKFNELQKFQSFFCLLN